MKVINRFALVLLTLLASLFCTQANAAQGGSRGYALCSFAATYTPRHVNYGDERGEAWIDVVFFDDDDPIPTEREIQQAFADHIRAGSWAPWNPRYDNENVDCGINRNSAPGQGRRNEEEWEARFRSEGWSVRESGGIYWWDSRAGRAKELLIQNSDWRGRTQHRERGEAGTGESAPSQAGAGTESKAAQPGLSVRTPGRPFTDRPGADNLKPKCAGAAIGTDCWKEIASKPGCYVFFPNSNPKSTITSWSRSCSRGVADGNGTLSWTRENGSSEQHAGSISDGKQHGHWVVRWTGGNVRKGPFVNGKEQGPWVIRYADGRVFDISFANGQQDGPLRPR